MMMVKDVAYGFQELYYFALSYTSRHLYTTYIYIKKAYRDGRLYSVQGTTTKPPFFFGFILYHNFLILLCGFPVYVFTINAKKKINI